MYSINLHLWPLGQAAKTPPSQGGIMGSIPVGVTKKEETTLSGFYFFEGEIV